MEYKTWMCLICGWIYDEALGDPEHGIAPGTKWEDVPMNWTCPECAARKEDFEMVAICPQLEFLTPPAQRAGRPAPHAAGTQKSSPNDRPAPLAPSPVARQHSAAFVRRLSF